MKKLILFFCLWIGSSEAFGQLIGLSNSLYPLLIRSRNDTPSPVLVRIDGSNPVLASLVLNSTNTNAKTELLFSRLDNVLNVDYFKAQILTNPINNTLDMTGGFPSSRFLTVNLVNNYVGINTNIPPTLSNLEVKGNFKVGTLGTTLSGISKGTFMFDLPTISANQTTSITFGVANAQVGSVVSVSSEGFLDPNIVIAYAFVSASNIVAVIITNISSTNAVDPPAMNFHATVIN